METDTSGEVVTILEARSVFPRLSSCKILPKLACVDVDERKLSGRVSVTCILGASYSEGGLSLKGACMQKLFAISGSMERLL